jgi:hypothetical protein
MAIPVAVDGLARDDVDLVVLIQQVIDEEAMPRLESDKAVPWRDLDPLAFFVQPLEASSIVWDLKTSELTTRFIHETNIMFLLTLINADEQHVGSPFRDLKTCVHR